MTAAASHGFQPPLPRDQRPWLWVAAILSLTYSLCALAARLTVKWEMLFYDDLALAAAYGLSVAHYGTVFVSISNGLGAAVSLVPAGWMSTASEFISRLLAVLSLCLSKISMVIFIRRIFSGDFHGEKRCFGVAYVAIFAYGLTAICLSTAGCRPYRVLVASPNAFCHGDVRTGLKDVEAFSSHTSQIPRLAIIAFLDVSTELILLCLPVWFIGKNQIKASKKRVVVLLFSFRLLAAAFSIVTTINYILYLTGRGAEETNGLALTVAWQEVLVGFSLISASIPCLRSFLWAFESKGLKTGTGTDTESVESSSPTCTRWAHQWSLQSLRSNKPRPASSSRNLAFRLRPDGMGYRVDVHTGERPPSKSSLNSTMAIAKRRSAKRTRTEHSGIRQTQDVMIRRSIYEGQ